jgi:hypothetical protein
MKDSKIMLAIIATFLLTWLFVAGIGYCITGSDVTFKECFSYPGTILGMFIVGWVPSAIVGADLSDKL